MRCTWSWLGLGLVLMIPAVAAANDDDESDGQVNFLPEDPDGPPVEPASPPLPFHFEATLGGVLSVPFANEPGETAFGFGMTYGIGYGMIPVMLGVDFISAGGGSGESLAVQGADGMVEAHKDSKSRTLYFDVWLRVQPRNWSVRPYIEGFAGAKLAMLQYSLNDGQSASDASWSDEQEWTSSLGYGAGVDFAGLLHLADTLSITLGARRVHGRVATFSLNGSVDGDKVSTTHDVAGSVTLFMLGIVAWFDMGTSS
ncbi:MAG TPA: hypothetical protein VJV78_25205 [Polyangiales bacterium]|nr:hypothetical protein [Polyangiales bacterium]